MTPAAGGAVLAGIGADDGIIPAGDDPNIPVAAGGFEGLSPDLISLAAGLGGVW